MAPRADYAHRLANVRSLWAEGRMRRYVGGIVLVVTHEGGVRVCLALGCGVGLCTINAK